MFLSTTAAFLARAVFEQGRDPAAEELAELSALWAGPDDLLSQMLWRGVRGRVLARRREFADAEVLAREAVALAGATDFVNQHAEALVDLSYVLAASGGRDEPVDAATRALDLYQRKGNVVAAAGTRLHLGKLDGLWHAGSTVHGGPAAQR